MDGIKFSFLEEDILLVVGSLFYSQIYFSSGFTAGFWTVKISPSEPTAGLITYLSPCCRATVFPKAGKQICGSCSQADAPPQGYGGFLGSYTEDFRNPLLSYLLNFHGMDLIESVVVANEIQRELVKVKDIVSSFLSEGNRFIKAHAVDRNTVLSSTRYRRFSQDSPDKDLILNEVYPAILSAIVRPSEVVGI